MKLEKMCATGKSLFVISLFLTALASLLLKPVQTAAQDATPSPGTPALAAALAQGGNKVAYHAETGKVRFIGAVPGRSISQPSALPPTASSEDAARGFLSAYGSLFGLTDQSRELIRKTEKIVDQNRSMVRFQQVYNTIPVIGGELIVNLNGNDILSANGEVLPDIALSTTPAISAAAAGQSGAALVSKLYSLPTSDLVVSPPELWIFNPMLLRPGKGATQLVWRMEVQTVGLSDIRELVLIDAQRGSVALNFNQIHTARNRLTYTANNTSSLPGTLVCNEGNPDCTGGDAHAAAAHIYAGSTYDFYFTNHGRNSINGAGLALKSTVHYGVAYENAFWNGIQMVYGDAYGFALADDVVGHELTHGVTEYESNLFYYYQSGAINESFSDVWGEFVDLSNGLGNDSAGVRWLVGEDAVGLNAIRNMADPPNAPPCTVPAACPPQPDTITNFNYYTVAGDNGGVHINSGVNNKAAYLLVDGGTFNGKTVTGLGITKTAKIYYEVQTNLLTSGSDYADLYDALYQACQNLIGGLAGITSGDCQEVRDATDAVEMNLQPVSNFNTDAPLCPGNQALYTTTFFDNLESGYTTNWAFGALSGTSRWTYDWPYIASAGRYAHSGLHWLFANDYPSTISDSFAAMKNSFTLPTSAYLHFAHAYTLESGFDGGIVQYSTNGGATWNSTDGLFEINGYDGPIFSGSGNPLGGQSAFTGVSHGYISSRLNLASLAGQNVRFRWRMGLDNLFGSGGWFLDDVRIYTCIAPPPNDDFANATPLASPPVSDGVITAAATVQASEQLPPCGTNVGKTVWYSYVATTTGKVSFDTEGSNFDSVLAVWTGAGLGSLTEVACNNNPTPSLQTASVTANLTNGTTYYVQIGGINGAAGNLLLSVAETPSNDSFANAITIPSVPYSNDQTNLGATLEGSEPTSTCDVVQSTHTVWYKYTATGNDVVTFDTLPSDFDTVVSVWTGAGLGSLTPVACNNDYKNDPTSLVKVNTTTATTYYIRASGYGNISGNLTLRATFPPAHDDFANAKLMPLTPYAPYSDSLSVVNSTVQTSEQTSTCDFNSLHTVWYKYTATLTNTITLTTAGSDYNTALSVWKGTTLGSLTPVVCNNDSGGVTSLVNLSAVAGTTYYVRVSDFNSVYFMPTSNLVFLAFVASPANAAPPRNFFTTPTPVLTWSRVTGATNYEINVSSTSTFALLEFATVLSGDTLTVTTSTLPEGVHYWRVRAKNSSGVWGAWSVVETFVVDVP